MRSNHVLPLRVRAVSLGWGLAFALGCATSHAPVQAPAPAPEAAAESAPTPLDAPPPDATPPTPTPAPAEPTLTGYTPEVAAVLAEPHIGWRTGNMRIALVRRGPVRLRPDGPDLGVRDLAPLPGPKRLRVVEEAERPRVVTDDGHVRLLVYVDRNDARPVLLRTAALRPTPSTRFGDPPRRGHVILKPGAWVDVGAREGTAARVTYQAFDSTMSGWIDADALGTSVTLVDPPPDERLGALLTRRSTKLLSRPGGKAIATLDVDLSVVPLSARADHGYRLVEHQPACEDDFVYVGFVRDRDLHSPNYGIGHGCGAGEMAIPTLFGEAEGAPRITLPAGRFLLDPDAPSVVGCVLEPAEVADLGDGLHAIATAFGPVPVRLAPASFEGRCGGA